MAVVMALYIYSGGRFFLVLVLILTVFYGIFLFNKSAMLKLCKIMADISKHQIFKPLFVLHYLIT